MRSTLLDATLFRPVPLFRLTLLASTALLTACATTTPDSLVAPPPMESTAVATPAPSRDQAAELKAFFEEYDKAELARSPMSKSYRAIKDGDYGKLDSFFAARRTYSGS